MITVKNDSVGLLNCNLDYIIPPIYKKIKPIWSLDEMFWVAEKNGGSTLIDSFGQVLFTNQYGTIIKDSYMLDLQRRVRSDVHTVSNRHFFEIVNHNKHGIVYADGTELIKPIYDEIRLVVSKKTDWRRDTAIFYWILKDGKKNLITDFYGNEIYSDTISANFHFNGMYIENDTIRATTLMIQDRINEQWFRYYNLQTGAISDTSYYGGNTGNNLISVYKDTYEQHRVFLNANLKVIYDTKEEIIISPINEYPGYYHLVFEYENMKMGVLRDDGTFLIAPADNQGVAHTLSGNEIIFWIFTELNPAKSTHKKNKLELVNVRGDLQLSFIFDTLYLDSFFSNSYLNWGCDSIMHSDLIFFEMNNKIGALDHFGCEVIPFEYDNYFGGKIDDNIHCEITGYHLSKNGKLGVVDPKGVEIYPFEYDLINLDFTHLELHYLKKNGEATVVDAKNGITYVTGADTAFFAYMRTSKITRTGKKELGVGDWYNRNSVYTVSSEFFAIKNDKLYWRKNDSLIICDSTIIDFNEQSILFENSIVFKSGFVIRARPNDLIEKAPYFYLKSNGDQTEIIGLNGEKGIRIKNFDKAMIHGDYVKIKLTDGLVGILSKDGKSWIHKPKYHDIFLADNFPDYTWVQIPFTGDDYYDERHPYIGNWNLIDKKGKSVHAPNLFIFPSIQKNENTSSVMQIGEKFGLFDSAYRIILPAQYDLIYSTELKDIYYVKTETKWMLYHIQFGFTSAYDDIAFIDWCDKFQVYQYTEMDTLIGYLEFDHGFRILQSPIRSDSVLQNLDLRLLLDISITEDHQLLKNRCVFTDTSWAKALQPLNNQMIYTTFNHNTINQHDLIYVQDLYYNAYWYWRDHDSYRLIIDAKAIREKIRWVIQIRPVNDYDAPIRSEYVWYYNSIVYSKQVYLKGYNGGKLFYENHVLCLPQTKIELADLFETPNEALAFIADYIEKEINRNQIFGVACIDMGSIVAEFMKCFRFCDGGLRFEYQPYNINNRVNIPYSEIAAFLKSEIRAYGVW